MEFQILIMKQYLQKVKLYLFLATIPLGLLSCEKVITLKLQDSNPIIVIDGAVSNQNESHTVRVSKTIPFDQTNSFNGLKGAQVLLKSSSGQTIPYTESTQGLYKSARFKGIPGLAYTLEVTVEGKTYSATSVMPFPVVPDSVGFKTLSFFGNSNIYPVVFYKDPSSIQNQYRYLIKVNGKLKSDLVTEDRFNDGNAVSELITDDVGDDLKPGDSIEVEMQCIDKNVFKYFFALSQIGGNGGPPVAPANPISNFNNNALGIFNACSKSTKIVVLK